MEMKTRLAVARHWDSREVDMIVKVNMRDPCHDGNFLCLNYSVNHTNLPTSETIKLH